MSSRPCSPETDREAASGTFPLPSWRRFDVGPISALLPVGPSVDSADGRLALGAELPGGGWAVAYWRRTKDPRTDAAAFEELWRLGAAQPGAFTRAERASSARACVVRFVYDVAAGGLLAGRVYAVVGGVGGAVVFEPEKRKGLNTRRFLASLRLSLAAAGQGSAQGP